jgi:repressor LexA
MNETLTPKQYKVLEIIKKHIAMTKDSPTVEELRCALGCNSQRTVSQYLESLERKGFIFRRKNTHRNIELRPAGSDNMPVAMTVSIPVVASVGCDDLSVFAQESYDEYLEVDKEIAEKEDNNLVAVRAIGDSMVDAGIQSGDYLLIRFTEHAENGDRVAAIIDDSIVVKRYEKKDNMVILWPESKDPKYKPIVLRIETARTVCSSRCCATSSVSVSSPRLISSAS